MLITPFTLCSFYTLYPLGWQMVNITCCTDMNSCYSKPPIHRSFYQRKQYSQGKYIFTQISGIFNQIFTSSDKTPYKNTKEVWCSDGPTNSRLHTSYVSPIYIGKLGQVLKACLLCVLFFSETCLQRHCQSGFIKTCFPN